MKAKDFFETLTSNSKKIISDDLSEDLNNVESFPPIGVQFFSMDKSDIEQLDDWIKLYNKLGVLIIVGDGNGITTELDDGLKSKINTTYSHFSIVGIRSNPEEMEKRLRERNEINIDEQCRDYEKTIRNKVKRASIGIKNIRCIMYLFLVLIALSMSLVLFIDVFYCAVASVFLYVVVLYLNKVLKKNINTEMNSMSNFEHNKDVYWDGLAQFNEEIIMRTLYERMID